MDVALFERQALGCQEAFRQIGDLARTCDRHGGTTEILIHNNSIELFGLAAEYPDFVASLAGAREP
jgi:hypothetical protein